MVSELNSNTFDALVQSNAFVLVDFWAPWCGPCINFAPVFEALAQKNPHITFAKVNIDESPDLADRFRVRSIPTFVLFVNGRARGEVQGARMHEI
jgi:thioredoxin